MPYAKVPTPNQSLIGDPSTKDLSAAVFRLASQLGALEQHCDDFTRNVRRLSLTRRLDLEQLLVENDHAEIAQAIVNFMDAVTNWPRVAD